MVSAEINPVSDLAKCDDCGQLNTIAALLSAPPKAPRNLYEVPPGSKFTIRQGSNKSLRLGYPANGFMWLHLFIIPFTLVWVGFVGFWTVMALKINYIVPLFSIPFWYAGASMMKGVYLGIRGWEEVLVNRQSIELREGHGKRFKTTVIPMREVLDIALQYKTKKDTSASEALKQMKYDPKRKRSYDRQPAIITEEKSYFFFQTASDFEQDWLIELLNDLRLKLA